MFNIKSRILQAIHTIVTWFEDKNEEMKLGEYLARRNYKHISCRNKAHFDDLLENPATSPSIVVIDLNLTEVDAILACNEVKSLNKSNSPFMIILGDKTEEYTHVTALDLGADDYIIKPIKPQVFLKRLEALVWRKGVNNASVSYSKKGLFIDSERHVVLLNNHEFELPKKEFELLNLFYSVPNKIFGREEIAILLWKEESVARHRTIDVHIRNIRKALGRNIIKTVKGFGYGLDIAAIA